MTLSGTWERWEKKSSCVYSLSLDTQVALVGVGVSVTATHWSKVQRTGQDLLCSRAGRLEEKTTNTHHVSFSLPVVNSSQQAQTHTFLKVPDFPGSVNKANGL